MSTTLKRKTKTKTNTNTNTNLKMKMKMIRSLVASLVVGAIAVVQVGCSSSCASTTSSTSSASSTTSTSTSPPTSPPKKTDAQLKADALEGIHDAIARDLEQLLKSAKELQAAAPTPLGRGWNETLDGAAIQTMREAWRRCRMAYEHVEGVIGAIFPDIDTSLDARYDDFLTTLGGKGDMDLFDKMGVTGMHAIERILYAPAIPKRTIDFEKTLPGYKPAAFPATAAEASRFKTELVQQLVDDAALLEAQWRPARIDAGVAFHGLVLLMEEQQEKMNKAATGEEESRYAEVTLFDLRHNLAGTRACYAFFRPWILAHQSAAAAAGSDPLKDRILAADKAILAGFETLSSLYNASNGHGSSGDALAQPPATWSSLNPSAKDLATPFGVLFRAVAESVDADKKGTLVFEMNLVAELLGFPSFTKKKAHAL